MKYLSKLLSFVMVLALCLCAMTVFASAETTTEVSGIYPYEIQVGEVFAANAVTLSEKAAYLSIEEAAVSIRDELMSREDVIYVSAQFPYDGAVTDEELGTSVTTYGLYILGLAMDHTGDPEGGDYLLEHFSGALIWASYAYSSEYYYVDYMFEMSYLSTEDQEEAVEDKIEDILDELNLENKSDYEKVCGVYDYLTEHVEYDYDGLNDSNDLTKYTAYGALIDEECVCQGYASAFYRMMLELDVDCRVITGMAYTDEKPQGEAHAWNIVKLGDQYYNLDATWDASWHQSGLNYAFFLRGSDNFTDHVSADEYLIPEFTDVYPISTEDYTLHTDPCQYGIWTTTVLPTASTQGVRERFCTLCGQADSEKQTIPVLDGNGVVVENITDASANDYHATLHTENLTNAILGDADYSGNSLVTVTMTTDFIPLDNADQGDMTLVEQLYEDILEEDQLSSDDVNAGAILLDINLYKQVDAGEVEKVTQTAAPVEITVDIPEDALASVPAAGSGVTRQYYIVRIHDGAAQLLEITDITDSTITFLSDQFSTYSVMYIDTAEETGPVYVAAIGDKQYETLAGALTAATSGQTVTLLCDTYELEILLRPGVTLDIGSNTLTTDFVIGLKGSAITATLHSKADVGGKLVVPQDSISLSTTAVAGPNTGYKVFPVWNEDHYVFAQVKINEYGQHGALTLLENNTTKLEFLPNLTSYVRDNLFKTDGCADNDVSIVIRVSWTESQAEGDIKVTQEYFYTTSLVQVAMNKISLTATTSGCDTKEGLEFTIAVVTEAGTEICSQTYVYADYVTE